MLWDSWGNVWRGRSLPKRRRVASGASLKRAADVAGAWSPEREETLEDRMLLRAANDSVKCPGRARFSKRQQRGVRQHQFQCVDDLLQFNLGAGLEPKA